MMDGGAECWVKVSDVVFVAQNVMAKDALTDVSHLPKVRSSSHRGRDIHVEVIACGQVDVGVPQRGSARRVERLYLPRIDGHHVFLRPQAVTGFLVEGVYQLQLAGVIRERSSSLL